MSLNREDCIRISQARLLRWGEFIGGHDGTPTILIGARHGQHSGQPILCTMEGLPDQYVVEILRAVADGLEGKRGITIPFSLR
jgi:hypothetical protein